MTLRAFLGVALATLVVCLLTTIPHDPLPPPDFKAQGTDDYAIATKTSTQSKRLSSKSRSSKESSPDGNTGTCDPDKQRMVIFIRHGHRLFWRIRFQDWLKDSFDKNGNYKPKDPNIPKTMYDRPGGWEVFEHDSPLHIPSYKEAVAFGKVLKKNNFIPKHVYSSLPLRCVETTRAILEGMGLDIPFNMESGLHERNMIHDDQDYMTPAELSRQGFNVNESYTSFYPRFDINTVAQVHERIHNVTRHIMDKHEAEGGNILIIAHANTGEMTVRLLTGESVPSNVATIRVVRKACKVPDFALTVARETCDKKAYWTRVDTQDLPYSYKAKCVDKYLTPKSYLRLLPNGSFEVRGEDKKNKNK